LVFIEKIKELEKIANEIRIDIVEMIGGCSSGHPGGSLSIADILTVLYFNTMKYKVDEPAWEDRDRLVLSKGHGAPALYSILSKAGFFPKKFLKTLRQIGSSLQGHPDRNSLPGIDMSTGSLGQGLSIANGMAIAARMDKKRTQNILYNRRRRISGRANLGSGDECRTPQAK